MKVMVIEPLKIPELREIKGDYESVKAIIGGYLEVIAFVQGTCAILDEESKVRTDKAPVRNPFGTYICQKALETQFRTLRPGDYIADTVVILGTCDENGEEDGEWHDIPQHAIDFIVNGFGNYET